MCWSRQLLLQNPTRQPMRSGETLRSAPSYIRDRDPRGVTRDMEEGTISSRSQRRVASNGKRGSKLTNSPLTFDKFDTYNCSACPPGTGLIVNLACRLEMMVSSPSEKLALPSTKSESGSALMGITWGRDAGLTATRRICRISIVARSTDTCCKLATR